MPIARRFVTGTGKVITSSHDCAVEAVLVITTPSWNAPPPSLTTFTVARTALLGGGVVRVRVGGGGAGWAVADVGATLVGAADAGRRRFLDGRADRNGGGGGQPATGTLSRLVPRRDLGAHPDRRRHQESNNVASASTIGTSYTRFRSRARTPHGRGPPATAGGSPSRNTPSRKLSPYGSGSTSSTA